MRKRRHDDAEEEEEEQQTVPPSLSYFDMITVSEYGDMIQEAVEPAPVQPPPEQPPETPPVPINASASDDRVKWKNVRIDGTTKKQRQKQLQPSRTSIPIEDSSGRTHKVNFDTMVYFDDSEFEDIVR